MILNEEQRLLESTISEFLSENAPIELMRRLRDDVDALGYSKDLWQQLVEMGIPLTTVAESDGGVGFGWLGMGAVMEACGRNLSASPLLASVVLCGSLLELAGNAKQRELLAAIRNGQTTLALALDEGNRFAPLQTATSLTPSNSGGYLLQGRKVFVVDGHCADHIIVAARSTGNPGDATGLSLAIIDPNQAGVKIKRTQLMDGSNAAVISFDSVAVNDDQLLGQPGEAWQPLQIALDRATTSLAAEMLGGCQELFDRTVEYLKEREQFDVKIGSFQALQHRASHMFCEIENCRSAVLNALSSLDNKAPDAAIHVSLAKTLANDCYKLVSNEAVQMHGGMGVTDELDIGLFLKRARVCMQLFGDTHYHENRYAEAHGF